MVHEGQTIRSHKITCMISWYQSIQRLRLPI